MDIISAYTTARSAAAAANQAEANTSKSASDGAFAELAKELAGKRADGAEVEKKAELVHQLADWNSAFYVNMRAQMKAQLERSKEEQEEQAVIDALGKVLDALSSKKDESGKKVSLNKSATELTQAIGDRISELDPDDPERIKLAQMLKRLQEMGIYINLDDADDLWESEDGTFETLTQLLTRRQAEEIGNTLETI